MSAWFMVEEEAELQFDTTLIMLKFLISFIHSNSSLQCMNPVSSSTVHLCTVQVQVYGRVVGLKHGTIVC